MRKTVGFSLNTRRIFLTRAIELSPLKLPLRPGVFQDVRHAFYGLHGLFNDSLPDDWGCLLLDRKLRKQGLRYDAVTPLYRLSLIGHNPMGALECEPAETGDDTIFPLELDSLSGEVENILDGKDSEVLDELLTLNGSSGGARPKITAYVSQDRKRIIHGGTVCPSGFTPWIIKFTEKQDGNGFGELEHRYSLAAKTAGIAMPETHLFPSQLGKGYFGVKRFDRTPQGKVHVHTACGLLHTSHRYSCLDYENLLKLTTILVKDQTQVEQMVLRMIFNVKSGNRDDHGKNFSFLLDEKSRWQLAPAYELTPSAGINGEQTAMVNGKGRDITDADLIAAAQTVDISTKEVRTMLDKVNTAIAHYRLC